MSQKPAKNCCIASEIMSLVIDGEHVFSSSELVHLESCTSCRLRFDRFRKLHSILLDHWRVPDDDFSADSVLLGVHRRIAAGKRLRPLRRFVAFSAAAVFFMICGAVVFNGALHPAPAPLPRHLATTAPATPDEAALYPYYYGRPAAVNNRNAFHRNSPQVAALPVTLLAPVNADNLAHNPLVSSLAGVLAGGADSLVRIEPEVSHVWAAGASDNLVPTLEKIIARLGVSGRCAITTSPNGDVRLTARGITKGELLRLVRQLNWHGWALLSPQPPQPESVIAFPNDGDPVDYFMTVVPVK